MKILRKSVYSHYLKKYEQASKMLKAAYVNYDKHASSFIETLNLCNCGDNSYWGNNPEKFFENQAALYETKEQLKHYRKALAYSTSLAKSLLKQRQREFTFAESNLHKAIKINGEISKRNAYDLLDTDDIEKENYYKLAGLTRYPIEDAPGFNPAVLKKQHECMRDGVDYVR